MKTEFVVLCTYVLIQLIEGFPAPRKIACPSLKLRYGRVRIRSRTFAQFTCSRGYLLAGEKYSKCAQGVWDSPPPICVRPSCRKVQQLQNGIIHPSHRGAVLNFYCAADFALSGPSRSFCVDNKWNSPMPSCLPTNATPSLSCDFETENICGWSHDLNHNFDWRRLNNKTPSGHLATGPRDDHTKGPGGNGYYMYIESSSRNVNDTARLISPMYNKESNKTCLEFYYHMYGFGIGQLRVYIKKINESWDFNLQDAIFWKEGNHGNEWFRAFIELGSINDQFQVIFEGVRATSYISDIAIDDVKIIENCVIDPMTTTEQELEATTFFYDSCSDRCNITSTLDMSCSCSEGCYENNTCCPDYIAVCLLGTYVDTTETDMTFTTEIDVTLITTVPPTEYKMLPQKTSPFSLSQKTSELALLQTTMKDIIPEATTTLRTTTDTITETPGKKPTNAPVPVIPNITQIPDIQEILTTLQQQKIETTVTPDIKINSTTTKSKPDQRETVTKTTITKYFLNDMLTLPDETKTEPDQTEKVTKTTKYFLNDMLTVPFEDTTDGDYHMDIDEEPKKVFTKEYPLDDDDSQPVFSDKVAPVHERPTPSNKTTVIAVLAICFIVIGVLGLVFLAKKYSSRNCINVRRMRSGNGDSQSDVRYLTSDELLDFRLAKV